MDFRGELFPQLFTNGVINGSWYGVLGLGFALILTVTGRFHLAYAVTYTLAAYVAVALSQDVGIPLGIAFFLAVVVASLSGVMTEGVVYRPLAAGGGGLLGIFIASLGLTIVAENLIRLTWGAGSASRSLVGFPLRPFTVLGVTFTSLDMAAVFTAWFLVLALAFFLSYTPWGRIVNAVRVNPEMARVVGINTERVHWLVFAIGSALAGVFAVYAAMRFAAVPDMGLQQTLIAFVVAFMALGTRPVSVALTGLALGLVESLSGLFLSAQWAPVVVFGVLFVYLALRPVQLRLALRQVQRLVTA
ncbi:High-affinity branched-chain amino acid transport system permease protein LivH [bacterium HR24]|jgi:branched-subunit amino acid ABC-type transport system permease component|nr:High-affinity branched-chain amino acid transport system permease protein LivH [bacterium HR24]